MIDHIDVAFGNISEEEAYRLSAGCPADGNYPAGCTEPWVANVVCALLTASGQRTVMETGCFLGTTSQMLADTLANLGGGDLILCETDSERAEGLSGIAATFVSVSLRQQDALEVIRELPDGWLGLAWVDDDHTKAHVAEEIEALIPKMAPNGLILLHDVFGACDLQEVVAAYGGYSLDFARCGPAGGLGCIQCR